jgi:SAM-dependent methyltransferase
VTSRATVKPSYFDAMYRGAADPWGLESRWYERRKYAITVALLPGERYDRAFEPGCSIGVLTSMLGQRCGTLLSCDGVSAAVAAAQARTRHLPSVTVERRRIPQEWPPGEFDLIIFSEFLYYFGDRDLGDVLNLGVTALRPGGTLLAVHWRHPVAEHSRDGDDVHQVLAARPGLARLVSHWEPDFAAEIYIRTEGKPVSVAQATGLA